MSKKTQKMPQSSLLKTAAEVYLNQMENDLITINTIRNLKRAAKTPIKTRTTLSKANMKYFL